MAKGIASGMPLGAMLTRADVMDWPPGSHASTFGGNPVSCRAALVTLDLIEREYLRNASERGAQLKAGLEKLAASTPHLANPRGLGLMIAIDVLDPSGKPNPQRRSAIVHASFHRGLLLLGCGKTAIRFCPPLCISAAEVETALEAFAAAARE
jgi:4-aminobutyrate aminotransferase